MPRSAYLLALAATVLISACKDKSPAPGNEPAPVAVVTPPAAGTPIESATFAPALGVDLKASTHTASGLYYRDIKIGTGAQAITGSHVSVAYVGTLPNGSVFDKSTPARPSYNLQIGEHHVVAGWEEGLVGMKVGGKRQLIIPASLGYGDVIQDGIPANSILVFTVELKDSK